MNIFRQREYERLQAEAIEAAREAEAQWRAEVDRVLGEEIYMLVRTGENTGYLAPTLDAQWWMNPGDIPDGMGIIRLRKGMLLSHNYTQCPNCGLYFDLNINLKRCLCGKSLPKKTRMK